MAGIDGWVGRLVAGGDSRDNITPPSLPPPILPLLSPAKRPLLSPHLANEINHVPPSANPDVAPFQRRQHAGWVRAGQGGDERPFAARDGEGEVCDYGEGFGVEGGEGGVGEGRVRGGRRGRDVEFEERHGGSRLASCLAASWSLEIGRYVSVRFVGCEARVSAVRRCGEI